MFDVDSAELVAKLAPKLHTVKTYIVLTDSGNMNRAVSYFLCSTIVSSKFCISCRIIPIQFCNLPAIFGRPGFFANVNLAARAAADSCDGV